MKIKSCCLAFASLLLSSAIADATTIPVLNTNNSLAGSLRQAVQDASPGDTVVFQIPTSDPGFNAASNTYFITLTAGPEMTIAKNLTIDGAGAKIVVQRSSAGGTPSFYFFNVTAGVVRILNLTLQNGANSGTGAAAIQNSANLTVKNCLLVGNNAFSGTAGSIHNLATGTLGLFNCTLSDNAGEVVVWNENGSLVLRDCTMFANHLNLAALYSLAPAVTRIRNTIAAGTTQVVNQNTSNKDVFGSFISEGYNLIGDASGASGFGATGDQLGATIAQVQLGLLRDGGGPTLTRQPLSGSVALDQGNRGVDENAQPINTDARGAQRPVDQPGIANSVGGDGSDIGAVETGLPQAGPTFTVTTTSDSLDGACSVDDCTLREALAASNAASDANRIVFAAGLSGELRTANQLSIGNPLTISGPGARRLQITGFANRAFTINTTGDITINNLSISNSVSSGAAGGAIIHVGAGTLFLSDCKLANNSANVGVGGGAIYNDNQSVLVLTRCTFSGNHTIAAGGAIYNLGLLTATNCTFSGNNALNGGAIISKANSGASNTTLRNCTFSGNSASDSNTSGGSGGGAIYAEGSASQYHFGNTVIAGNTSSGANPDLRGNVTSDGHNFIGQIGSATGLTNGVNGDQVGSGAGINPQLNPLADNGGGTDTQAILSTSPVRDAGDNNLAPTTDQRGYLRSGVSDIGAFEFNGVAQPINFLGAVSRKVHGAAGTFDINLPLSDSPGVECRIGANNDFQLVFTFATPVTFNTASVISGIGAVLSSTGSGTSIITTNLGGVINAQKINVTISGVSNGASMADFTVPMGVLAGDTTGNGTVSGSDVSQTKLQSGQAVGGSNFRTDVTVSGTINGTDVSNVKAKSGTGLP